MVLYEADTVFRQIFSDGRALPVDPQPSWLGYSVGKWVVDAFVVETVGFNDKAPLDALGHPRSEALRLTERFRRRDFGHMDVQITIDDAKLYTKPVTILVKHRLLPDTELLESFCNENEKDLVHLHKRTWRIPGCNFFPPAIFHPIFNTTLPANSTRLSTEQTCRP